MGSRPRLGATHGQAAQGPPPGPGQEKRRRFSVKILLLPVMMPEATRRGSGAPGSEYPAPRVARHDHRAAKRPRIGQVGCELKWCCLACPRHQLTEAWQIGRRGSMQNQQKLPRGPRLLVPSRNRSGRRRLFTVASRSTAVSSTAYLMALRTALTAATSAALPLLRRAVAVHERGQSPELIFRATCSSSRTRCDTGRIALNREKLIGSKELPELPPVTSAAGWLTDLLSPTYDHEYVR
jgi:hypothetical protein